MFIKPSQSPLQSQPGVSIDLTPIIDMVFLLLIFFLVATTFHQTEQELQIALPSVSAAQSISVSLRELVIHVNRQGEIIVNGQTISADALRTIMTETVAANPQQKVTLRGDRDAAYASIARVLDICKVSGIQEPYLDTAPTQ